MAIITQMTKRIIALHRFVLHSVEITIIALILYYISTQDFCPRGDIRVFQTVLLLSAKGQQRTNVIIALYWLFTLRFRVYYSRKHECFKLYSFWGITFWRRRARETANTRRTPLFAVLSLLSTTELLLSTTELCCPRLSFCCPRLSFCCPQRWQCC